MEDLIILAVILIVTYITGSVIEKNHYKSIKQREIALIRKPIVNYGVKEWDSKRKIKHVELVTGEVVVGVGYFKSFVASLKSLFGGRLTSIESVMDRGRREAILRMREKAVGANFIINARVDTVMLNDLGGKNADPQCAIIASGTAITYE